MLELSQRRVRDLVDQRPPSFPLSSPYLFIRPAPPDIGHPWSLATILYVSIALSSILQLASTRSSRFIESVWLCLGLNSRHGVAPVLVGQGENVRRVRLSWACKACRTCCVTPHKS